jgi:hypothetical protein
VIERIFAEGRSAFGPSFHVSLSLSLSLSLSFPDSVCACARAYASGQFAFLVDRLLVIVLKMKHFKRLSGVEKTKIIGYT